MKIAFCKIGKSIKFASAYSPTGGDNEAPTLLRLLANNNPDVTFYITGRSDFTKLTESQRLEQFPYDNVIDVYEGKRGPADVDGIINYFKEKGFQPDACVAMVGQVGTVTIPGMIKQVKDRDLIASVIEMTKNYSSPIIKWLNEENSPPVIEIINDPRYTLHQARDIIFNPKVSLSQYNYTYEKNSINDYVEQERTIKQIPVTYAEMEKIFLYDNPIPPINTARRDTNFMVVLNEGSPSRYDMLKEWVLDNIEDVEIYGAWTHKATETDDRFKGSLKLDEVHKKLQRVRCTFIIPIAKGWVTSKYIEMIHAGVVPLFHPTYDEQDNTGANHGLRPKNPKQMMQIVKMLEDDNVYEKVITQLREQFCLNEYLDGSKLNQNIMSTIDSNYKAPDLSKYEKEEAFNIESFF